MLARSCKAAGMVAAILALGGCTPAARDYSSPPLYETRFMPPGDADVAAASYAAAERLMAQVGEPLDARTPILVTTIADAGDLDHSSALGRMIADQLASRLAQLGYSVSESRLRGTLAINPNGEFVLSRDVRRISGAHTAQVVLAGTYTPGDNEVYVDLRLVRLVDARVLASFDYALPAGPNTRSLLMTAAAP
ncbi:MAG: FlgO family outer membrane protein [Dongiaceae bacterium]